MIPDDALADLARRAPRIGRAVAYRFSRPDLADELEAATYEGLARAHRSWPGGSDMARYAGVCMFRAAFDAARTWVGRDSGRKPAAWPVTLVVRLAEFRDDEDARLELAAVLERIAEMKPLWQDAVLADCRGETDREVARRWGLSVEAGRVSQIRRDVVARLSAA